MPAVALPRSNTALSLPRQRSVGGGASVRSGGSLVTAAKYTGASRLGAMLLLLDVQGPWLVEFLILVVEAMQLVAVGFQERVPWPTVLPCVFYVTHLPLWDPAGTCLPYSADGLLFAHIAALAAVCTVAGAVTVTGRFLLSQPEPRPWFRWYRAGLIAAFHLVTRPLYVPLTRLLLHGGWAQSWALGAFGLVAAAGLTSMALVSRGLLFDASPLSTSPRALAHGRVHMAMTLALATILALLAATTPLPVQIIWGCTSVGLAGAFWYFQPHLVRWVNGVLAGTFLAAALGCLLAIVLHSLGRAVTAVLWVWVALGACLFLLGCHASRFRFQPLVDVVSHSFPELVQLPFADSDEPIFLQGCAPPHTPDDNALFLLPVTSTETGNALTGNLLRARTAEEVELAVRDFHRRRDLPPQFQAALVRYMDLVYRRALLLFPTSTLVRVQYAGFLRHSQKQQNRPYHILKAVLMDAGSALDAWYMAHKLLTSMTASAIRIHDVHTQAMLRDLRRQHRAALVQRISLWHLLMSEAATVAKLDRVVTAMQRASDASLDLLRPLAARRVHLKNPAVLVQLVEFLRTVLNDREAAEAMLNQEEAAAQSETGSQAPSQVLSRHNSMAPSAARSAQSLGGSAAADAALPGLLDRDRHDAPHHQQQRGQQRLPFIAGLGFVALTVLAGVSCGLYFQHNAGLQATLNLVNGVGIARGASAKAYASTSALELQYLGLDTCGVDPRDTFALAAAEMQAEHQRTTTGDRAVSGPMLDYYRVPRVPAIRVLDAQTQASVAEVFSMWELGFRQVDVMLRVQQLWADTANLSLADVASDEGVLFLLFNGPGPFSHAWNVTVSRVVDYSADIISEHTLLQVILLALMLVVVVALGLAFNWSHQQIYMDRSFVLYLLTQIPYSTLQKLAHEAEADLERFERMDQLSVEEERSRGPAQLPHGLAKDAEDPDFPAAEEGAEDEGGEGDDAASVSSSEAGAPSATRLLRRHAVMALLVLLVLQCVLSVSAVMTIYLTIVTETAVPAPQADRQELLAVANRFVGLTDNLSSRVRRFVQFGDRERYAEYWDMVESEALYRLMDRLMELGSTQEEQTLMLTALGSHDNVMRTERIAQRLSVAALGLDPAAFVEAAAADWDAATEPGDPFDWRQYQDTGLHYTNRSYDLSLPPDQQDAVARSIVFDARYLADEAVVASMVTELNALSMDRTQKQMEAAVATLHTWLVLSFAIFGVLLLSFLPVVALARQLRLLSGLVLAMLTASIFWMMVVLALLATVSVTLDARQQQYRDREQFSGWHTRVRDADVYLNRKALRVPQFGEVQGYKDYWKAIRASPLTEEAAAVQAATLTDPELQLLSQYKANLSALHYRHKISQVIGLNAFGYNVSQFAEVATFYWDVEAEPNHYREQLQYPDRPYAYTNRTADLQLPVPTQRLLARYLLSDAVFEQLDRSTIGAFDSLLQAVESRFDAQWADSRRMLDAILTVLLACDVLFVAFSFALVLLLMSKLMQLRAAGIDAEDLLANPRGQLRFYLAIQLAPAMILIMVAFSLIHLFGFSVFPSELSLSTDRSWLLMRLMHYCQLQALDVADAQKTDIRLLAHTLDLIDEVRDFLYFGNPTSSGLVHKLIFDQPTPIDGFKDGGLDDLTMAWMQRASALAIDSFHPPVATLLEEVGAMWCEVPLLFKNLEKTRQLYFDDGLTWLAWGKWVEIGLAVAVGAALALGYALLAMPLVRKLLDFDDMTKALLRVLPETALATVPSLLAYKRTGVLSVSQVVVKKNLEEASQLLSFVLPPAICARLKAGENPIADYCRDVSILFTHLSGFARLTALLAPRDLVGLLNSLFQAYDKLVEAKGLEKIKTVGDAYMMAGNLLRPEPDAARLAVECGLEMLALLEGVNQEWRLAPPLRQSCGVNTGNVVAGVLGYTTVAFDIWGDAVNVASRMESNGQVGAVQVSPTTWALVKPYFVAEELHVSVKGKGCMAAYRIWPKGASPPLPSPTAAGSPLAPPDPPPPRVESKQILSDVTLPAPPGSPLLPQAPTLPLRPATATAPQGLPRPASGSPPPRALQGRPSSGAPFPQSALRPTTAAPVPPFLSRSPSSNGTIPQSLPRPDSSADLPPGPAGYFQRTTTLPVASSATHATSRALLLLQAPLIESDLSVDDVVGDDGGNSPPAGWPPRSPVPPFVGTVPRTFS
eukprot:EG_transcript_72